MEALSNSVEAKVSSVLRVAIYIFWKSDTDSHPFAAYYSIKEHTPSTEGELVLGPGADTSVGLAGGGQRCLLNAPPNTASQVWGALNIYHRRVILLRYGPRLDRRAGNIGVFTQSQPAKFELSSETGVSTVFAGGVEERDMRGSH